MRISMAPSTSHSILEDQRKNKYIRGKNANEFFYEYTEYKNLMWKLLMAVINIKTCHLRSVDLAVTSEFYNRGKARKNI